MIKIELSTIESEGLLLWQGKNDNKNKNYIALGIRNGQVFIFLSSYTLKLSLIKIDSVI